MDYNGIVIFLNWLLILIVITCVKHVNQIEASLTVHPLRPIEIVRPFKIRTNNGSSKNEIDPYSFAGYTAVHPETYCGVRGILNLWSLNNVLSGELSLVEISIGKRYQVMQLSAGWIVNPRVFADDRRPRLYAAYMLNDGTTCYSYEPLCDEFIMTDPSQFTNPRPTSITLGRQYEIDVKIILDPIKLVWTLKVDDVQVGYWSSNSTSGLMGHARQVLWLGGVLTSRLTRRPPMGSGKFPEEGPGKASYIREVQYITKDYRACNPTDLREVTTDHSRYGASQLQVTEGGSVSFYFGGPGRL